MEPLEISTLHPQLFMTTPLSGAKILIMVLPCLRMILSRILITVTSCTFTQTVERLRRWR